MSIPPISPPQAEYQWAFCHLSLRYSVDRFDFLTHGLACTACSPAIWRVFRVCRSPSKRLRRFLVSPTPHPPPECFYRSSASLPLSPPLSIHSPPHPPPPTNHLHVSMHSAVVQLTSPPPPPSSTSTSFEISPPSALTSFRYFFKLSSATFFTFSSFPHTPPSKTPRARFTCADRSQLSFYVIVSTPAGHDFVGCRKGGAAVLPETLEPSEVDSI